MKRVLAVLASLVLFVGLGVTAPLAANAAPYCGISWGSTAESRAGMSTAPLTDLRAGRHSCFDRLVIDLDQQVAGYSVSYVSAVHRPGSGSVVPLAGGADLEVVVNAPAYDEQGSPTYDPSRPDTAVAVSGYSTFRQVAFAGSFEGETTIGLGVRARLPMRAFVLDGPGNDSRLVIDVAHRW
jgi:hypothetical protein